MIKELLNPIVGNYIFLAGAAFITAFVISFLSIPKIINAARLKNLYDVPTGRASHRENTPTLGGIAIFASLLISVLTFVRAQEYNEIQYYIVGLTIMFFVGLKDDLLKMSALRKLSGQLTAALMLIVLGNVRLTNLYGFMGIGEINYMASVFLSLFVYVVIINCMNLIDGIDGLAAGIGILTAIVLGTWFYLIEAYAGTIIAASLLGTLIPFFRFNVFGKKNKLFMGDTGSLIIGITIAVLLIKFNELNIGLHSAFAFTAAPAVSIGLFFIPLYDTLQVFFLRIIDGRSPFSPDKNHLHHFILHLSNNHHLKTTSLLIAINLLVIAVAFYFQSLGIVKLTLLLLLIGIIISGLLRFLLSLKRAKK